MLNKLVLLIHAAIAAVPATAADLQGTWKLTAEGKVALTLDVQRQPSGAWFAKVRKPDGMSIENGTSVANMGASTGERTLIDSAGTPEKLALRFDPARPGEDRVRMSVAALDADHAEMIVAIGGQESQPMALRRAGPSERVASSWEPRRYSIDPAWPDNAAIQGLFAEDQADRADPASIDLSRLIPRDQAREAQTMVLLNGGMLRSGQDYYAAAVIFQHGQEAKDFLLAHSLALAALARGEPQGAWVAAATLDRYLQKIGQPQVYGTQFDAKKGEKASQGNYDRTLVPDSLRQVLGVPSLAEQEVQRRAWEKEMNPKP